MQDLTTLVSAIAPLTEKLGIIGLLFIAIYFLVREVLRMRKELAALRSLRDKYRIAYVKCRAACSAATPPIKFDLGDLHDLLEGESETPS
jgi:hypothetical protein